MTFDKITLQHCNSCSLCNVRAVSVAFDNVLWQFFNYLIVIDILFAGGIAHITAAHPNNNLKLTTLSYEFMSDSKQLIQMFKLHVIIQ